MTFREALSNLYSKYGKYGFEREFLSDQLRNGIMEHGFSVNTSYNGLRMILAQETGEHEYFSLEDVMEITGESREEILDRIEEFREELAAAFQQYAKVLENIEEQFEATTRREG